MQAEVSQSIEAMNCEKCNVRDFVHFDIYCQGCDQKPEPRIKTGRAYLFRKDTSRPISSVEIEAPDGMEYEVAAVELMGDFRIEFIESDSKKFTETILEEIR